MTVKTPFKVISIQPESPKDDPFKLPYPYHISKTGLVGRQDFWKGEPYKLIGFADTPGKAAIDVRMSDFWDNPENCVGFYPVFAHKGDKWFTYSVAIKSVHVNETDV